MPNLQYAWSSLIPNEILVEIIRNTFLDLDEIDHRNPDKIRINLSSLPYIRVCKHWRNTMISCPFLWKNLTISARVRKFENDTARAKKTLSAWLKHSGTNPLSLSLHSYEFNDPDLREF
jgi:hypothetical protein